MTGFVPLRERLFLRALREALAGCTRVLDVGCGAQSPLARAGVDAETIGVDRSLADLAAARAAGTHDAYVCADGRDLERLIGPCGVEAVVALDVIEHLEKADALALVETLARVAHRRVVVFTPNGFVPQPGTTENPWQEHRCGFTAAELRALGFRVRGAYGLRWLSGPYGHCRVWPRPLWRRVADLTALALPVPELSFGLLGVKDVAAPDAQGLASVDR